MNMTETEHKALRDYCAFLLKEYGFHFATTDPIIPALYVIHQEHQRTNTKNETIALVVKHAADSIQPKAFHFHSSDASFHFQVGIAVKWAIMSFVAFLIVGMTIWGWKLTTQENRKQTESEMQFLMEGLIQQIRKDHDGIFFIDFSASKGDSVQRFKEYRRINKSTVRIYLGSKLNTKASK